MILNMHFTLSNFMLTFLGGIKNKKLITVIICKIFLDKRKKKYMNIKIEEKDVNTLRSEH